MSMPIVFPLAFVINTSAVTILLILLGLSGRVEMATDVAIAHGATLALFYAFSANARSLILSDGAINYFGVLLRIRLLLIVPLTIVAYFLSVTVADVSQYLGIAIILRRGIDWIVEVYLSELERSDDRRDIKSYIYSQGIFLVLLVIWIFTNTSHSLVGLYLWALSPLICIRSKYLKPTWAISVGWRNIKEYLVPHFGSTAIIGVTVYVFRLMLVLYVGKNFAGDLFTAFSIGGLLGSLYMFGLGPSMALSEYRSSDFRMPRLLKMIIILALTFGGILATMAFFEIRALLNFGKSYLFWSTVGISLVGGSVMIIAQRVKFRIIQTEKTNNVFGADVLMNVLVIAVIPYVFYLLGKDYLIYMYLFVSIIALIFYTASGKGLLLKFNDNSRAAFLSRIILILFLILPVFMLTNGTIFHDTTLTYDTAGKLARLPVPFMSLASCYIGIALIGMYRRANYSFTVVFLLFILMNLSTIITTIDKNSLAAGKFLLVIQFILPVFALVFGQIIEKSKNDMIVEKVFLYMLVVIVPVQLLSTYFNNTEVLSPDLFFFSIYQHLEYVPVIFVAGYILSLFSLWVIGRHKILILFLTPAIALYAAASQSIIAVLLLVTGVIIFVMYSWRNEKTKYRLVLVFMLSVPLTMGYLYKVKSIDDYAQEYNTVLDSNYYKINKKVSPAARDRMDDWRYYLSGIKESPKAFLFGHIKRPPRSEHTSAHNYYIDFVYSYGVIAVLPLLVAIIYTLIQICSKRRIILANSSMIGLVFVTLFFLIIDQNLKVGLRQPYPGIIIFFIWGVLLNRLIEIADSRKTAI